MNTARTERLQVTHSEDVVRVRQAVRNRAVELGFSLVDQTKLITAASELARNIVDYAMEGTVTVDDLIAVGREGIRIVFEDRGPGIPDVDLAMKDGYTTGKGLGMGLGGARRLVNDFSISSEPGKGTRVEIRRWR